MKRKNVFRRTPYILCLTLLLILPFADSFAEAGNEAKSVRIDTGQAASYDVWHEGAVVQLSLEEGVHNGNGALRADLIEPNAATGEKSGSFYHILPENKRDWSKTAFIKFWLKNASGQNLLLNLSFKEAASEDWGLGREGSFFLEDADGMLYKTQFQYCNLEIPAEYEGYVLLPFSSLVVPDWSTASGDGVLALSNIETYAFGAQYAGTRQTFYLDDITVASSPEHRVVCIQMEDSAVEIPKEGSSDTLLGAYVTDLEGALEKEDVSFRLGQDYPGISLTKDGTLTVYSNAGPADVQVTAAVAGKPQYFHRFVIHVVRDKASYKPADDLQTEHTPAATADSSAAVSRMDPQQTAIIAAAAVSVLIGAAAVISAIVRKRRNS